MSTKEILIKEIETLDQSDLSRVRRYIYDLKTIRNEALKPFIKNEEVDMEKCRRILSSIKGNMSDTVIEEREDRI